MTSDDERHIGEYRQLDEALDAAKAWLLDGFGVIMECIRADQEECVDFEFYRVWYDDQTEAAGNVA